MPSDMKLAGLDNPLLPNDVLDDNYARACKYDKMTGVMSIDTSVAMAIISEVREARLAALPASTELSREAQSRDEVVEQCAAVADGVRRRLQEGRKGRPLNQVDEHAAGIADNIAADIRALKSEQNPKSAADRIFDPKYDNVVD